MRCAALVGAKAAKPGRPRSAEGDDAGRQFAVARTTVLEPEAEAVCGGFGAYDEFRIVDLGQVDESGVVAEVVVAEFGVAVEAEEPDHESVEVTGQVVREVEGPNLGVLELGEGISAGEELVAVGAGQAFDAEILADCVQPAAGAAVGVADVDLVVPVPGRKDPRRDGVGDEVRGVVV